MAATTAIYQFKVSLKGTKPKIWRRIQVPSTFTFDSLHGVIQDAMGWEGGHLHQFNMKHPRTGERISIGEPAPDDGFGFMFDIIPEETARIARYFAADKTKAVYVYDFGDNWQHEVVLEKKIPADASVQYPRCIAGKRACPPEDCGGIWGYAELLTILADPEHDEYNEKMEWLDDIGRGDFQPDEFDPKSVLNYGLW